MAGGASPWLNQGTEWSLRRPAAISTLSSPEHPQTRRRDVQASEALGFRRDFKVLLPGLRNHKMLAPFLPSCDSCSLDLEVNEKDQGSLHGVDTLRHLISQVCTGHGVNKRL